MMEKNRYFMQLAYKGTNFHGWQIQPNGITIQEEITKALQLILQQPELTVLGVGRTDAGVHAKDFYLHFDSSPKIVSTEELVFKLNRFLRPDIAIRKIFKVNPDAHARFDAQQREYHYYITNAKDPFMQETSWYLYGELDVKKMNAAAECLLKYTDFTSFSKLHTQVKTNNCEIRFAQWERSGSLLIFKIAANRFLRNMVRAIVGTLIEVGKGKMSVQEFEEVIESKNRSRAGESAPAEGLFLWKIDYDFEKIMKVPSLYEN